MTDRNREPWVEFLFEGPPGAAVEARAVGQLLVDLSAAARQVAADILGSGEPRGPLSKQEAALIGFTLKRIGPGSVLSVELAPPAVPLAVQLEWDSPSEEQLSADQVIRELREDLAAAEVRSSAQRRGRRESLRALRSSLRSIAPSAAMRGTGLSDSAAGAVTAIPLEPHDQEDSGIEQQRRVLFGHLTMADVYPQRQRVRLTQANGARHTLDVINDLALPLRECFDRHVELRVLDTVDGGEILKSEVESVRLLEPGEIGPDFPAKSWHQLAKEQGIDLDNPPDYVAMLRKIFDTEEIVQEFNDFVGRSTYQDAD